LSNRPSETVLPVGDGSLGDTRTSERLHRFTSHRDRQAVRSRAERDCRGMGLPLLPIGAADGLPWQAIRRRELHGAKAHRWCRCDSIHAPPSAGAWGNFAVGTHITRGNRTHSGQDCRPTIVACRASHQPDCASHTLLSDTTTYSRCRRRKSCAHGISATVSKYSARARKVPSVASLPSV